jgi:hypothetical protein
MTAAATIPSTDITGLGTMAAQNSNNISVTGGTMSGVAITGYIPTTEKAQPLGVATLDAAGKVPTSQIPMQGDLNYQGTWNASTNTPTLTSSVGTKGYYYVVDVAGSTNLNGITDWQIGDWAIFNGSIWQKVDNTDAVTSVNGQVGAVVLTTTNIAEGTNLYYTDARARAAISAGTGISYNNTTGVITNSSPSLGGDVVGPASATDNAIARYDTTTGKLIQNSTATIDDTGILATSKGLIGSGANFTDYPSAQFVSTQSKISGYGHAYKIGVVGEAQASSSDSNIWGIGVHGRGWTNNATRCAGLEGDAGVTNSADTGTATAVRANSTSTHSGGLNIGVTIDVSGSSVNNYALYMINGNLYSAAAQTWELVDNSNSALVFNSVGKTGILDIITTNGAEGISTSGTLTATGTTSLGTLGVTGTSTLSNVAITGTTSFDGSQGTSGQVLTSQGTGVTPIWTTPTTGTVTSVTGTSPVVSSGGNTPAISLAASYGDTQNPYASKTANNFLAAPNGSAGAPTFRAIVAADIPTLNQNTTGTAANVTGIVAFANGGTGETTRQAAIDALAGAVTSGQYLRGNGTDVVMSAIQAADVPTLNQNTTGNAATVTNGVVTTGSYADPTWITSLAGSKITGTIDGGSF